MNTTQTGSSVLRRTVRVGTVVMAVCIAVVLGTPAHATTVAELHASAMAVAAAQKNKPYKTAGVGPNSFDCSGLTQFSFKSVGKAIPRTAQSQYNATTHVSATTRHVGDLIFIGKSSKSIYHTGFYAGVINGKGYMWNANSGSYRGKKVVLAPVTEYTAGSPQAYYGQVK